eukprot:TRINITY_DN1883_c0_g1_i1.p1 TRINITY_DN1883_c0_g1~~TRINITY_DN1883_c0_g1_i1.p1  ORF type:complete len:201 (-),score=1.62 TRINITY_DN1883_c0_g1_i1:288-890(-)
MIRRPPRSTLSSSSAASDVYKRQAPNYWYDDSAPDPPASTTWERPTGPAHDQTYLPADMSKGGQPDWQQPPPATGGQVRHKRVLCHVCAGSTSGASASLPSSACRDGDRGSAACGGSDNDRHSIPHGGHGMVHGLFIDTPLLATLLDSLRVRGLPGTIPGNHDNPSNSGGSPSPTDSSLARVPSSDDAQLCDVAPIFRCV